MIRTDAEYRQSLELLRKYQEHVAKERERLQARGEGGDRLRRGLEPLQSFAIEIQDEIAEYERLKAGHLDARVPLRGLPWLLTALRIQRGITQAALAARLGVHVTQVSRDERGNYQGITLDRAIRVLEALDADPYIHLRAVPPKAARAASRARGEKRAYASRAPARRARAAHL